MIYIPLCEGNHRQNTVIGKDVAWHEASGFHCKLTSNKDRICLHPMSEIRDAEQDMHVSAADIRLSRALKNCVTSFNMSTPQIYYLS